MFASVFAFSLMLQAVTLQNCDVHVCTCHPDMNSRDFHVVTCGNGVPLIFTYVFVFSLLLQAVTSQNCDVHVCTSHPDTKLHNFLCWTCGNSTHLSCFPMFLCSHYCYRLLHDGICVCTCLYPILMWSPAIYTMLRAVTASISHVSRRFCVFSHVPCCYVMGLWCSRVCLVFWCLCTQRCCPNPC